MFHRVHRITRGRKKDYFQETLALALSSLSSPWLLKTLRKWIGLFFSSSSQFMTLMVVSWWTHWRTRHPAFDSQQSTWIDWIPPVSLELWRNTDFLLRYCGGKVFSFSACFIIVQSEPILFIVIFYSLLLQLFIVKSCVVWWKLCIHPLKLVFFLILMTIMITVSHWLHQNCITLMELCNNKRPKSLKCLSFHIILYYISSLSNSHFFHIYSYLTGFFIFWCTIACLAYIFDVFSVWLQGRKEKREKIKGTQGV